MRPLPIRLRLTLVFAGALTLILAGGGVLLYERLQSNLDRSVVTSLRARADDVSALAQSADTGLQEAGHSRLATGGERFAQLIGPRGVVDATPETGRRPLLDPRQLALARRGTIIVDRPAPPEQEGPIRLLATPVRAQDQQLVVVVGESLATRDEALHTLALELLIGGPLVLLLVSIAAYRLAAAALRPVERMRRQAAAISLGDRGKSLTVPQTRDEVAQLGETLNELLGRVEGALERERSFVADASHELRMPLALLKTELELALARPRTAEELRAAVRSAAEEADRLARLAEDLLVLARAGDGKLPVRRSPTSAGALLRSVIRRYERPALEAGRALESTAPADLTLNVDPLRIEQAVGNLVHNALRHGGGAVRIEAVHENGNVELHVVDDGAGFPAGFVERAFERFSRADEARQRGGAGLGLAIVEVIARAHGGTAHLRNRPEGGADVWLDLPRA
jgi:signal transduction histidine kinase